MERIPRLNVSGSCYNNNIKKIREIKMDRRYTFGGFEFGSQGQFHLVISAISPTQRGGTHGLEMAIDLSPEEVQELITILISRNVKEDN